MLKKAVLMATLSLLPALAMDEPPMNSTMDTLPSELKGEINDWMLRGHSQKNVQDPSRQALLIKKEFAKPRTFSNIDDFDHYLNKALAWNVKSLGPITLECHIYALRRYIQNDQNINIFPLLGTFSTTLLVDNEYQKTEINPIEMFFKGWANITYNYTVKESPSYGESSSFDHHEHRLTKRPSPLGMGGK